jgi:hypothetical protein
MSRPEDWATMLLVTIPGVILLQRFVWAPGRVRWGWYMWSGAGTSFVVAIIGAALRLPVPVWLGLGFDAMALTSSIIQSRLRRSSAVGHSED